MQQCHGAGGGKWALGLRVTVVKFANICSTGKVAMIDTSLRQDQEDQKAIDVGTKCIPRIACGVIWCHGSSGVIWCHGSSGVIWCHGSSGVMDHVVSWIKWSHGSSGVIWCHGSSGVI